MKKPRDRLSFRTEWTLPDSVTSTTVAAPRSESTGIPIDFSKWRFSGTIFPRSTIFSGFGGRTFGGDSAAAKELVIKAVGERDQRAAQDVLLLKDDIRDLSDQLFERHVKRLSSEDPRYLERVRLLMSFIEQLRHMYTLTKRIAKVPVQQAREAA